jgi:hypothetical protein
MGSVIRAFRSERASLDQLRCHVVSDQSAQKLYQVHEHRLYRLGSGGVSVRDDSFGDAANVGVRFRAKLDLAQRRVFSSRFRECAGEKRVTTVRSNPPREFTV